MLTVIGLYSVPQIQDLNYAFVCVDDNYFLHQLFPGASSPVACEPHVKNARLVDSRSSNDHIKPLDSRLAYASVS